MILGLVVNVFKTNTKKPQQTQPQKTKHYFFQAVVRELWLQVAFNH